MIIEYNYGTAYTQNSYQYPIIVDNISPIDFRGSVTHEVTVQIDRSHTVAVQADCEHDVTVQADITYTVNEI